MRFGLPDGPQRRLGTILSGVGSVWRAASMYMIGYTSSRTPCTGPHPVQLRLIGLP